MYKDLYIDGVGTTSLGEETKIIAHLPILLHPDADDILVIAFGMGTTFRSALSYPDTHVDVVELVPSIPSLIGFFHPDGNETLKNPRGKVIINDGRNYVFMTRKKYDVVTIDPPPPTNGAGTTVLFSDEFYKDIKQKLKDRGIVQNWIYFDQDIDSVRMMTKSFVQNFEYAQVFLSRRNNGIFLVGSDYPIQLDEQRINAYIQIPGVKEDMTEWNSPLFTYDFLKERYVGNKNQLMHFAGSLPAVTDDHPYTEYALLRHLMKPQPTLTGKEFEQSL